MYRSVISFLLFLLSASSCFSVLPTVVHGGVYDPRNNIYVENIWLEPGRHPSTLLIAQLLVEATTKNKIPTTTNTDSKTTTPQQIILTRGGGLIPAGYNPFGYKITPLGEKYLEFPGSLDSDIGRFIASIKDRKTLSNIKSQWLEIVRVSKSAQSMRIYRTLQDIIDFCLEAGFIN